MRLRRNIYSVVLILMAAITLVACHSEEDDYYSDALFVFQMDDGSNIEQMQGTLTLRNTSNGQEYSESEISGGNTTLRLLRGAYSLSAEGTVIYTSADGQRHTASFRSSIDYLQVLDNTVTVPVSIIIIK